MSTPKVLRQEESLAPEYKEFISTLPRKKGWYTSYLYQYQGFWFTARHLQGVIASQKHFVPQNSDVFLVTNPKSGTTWLKAIMFTLLNRKRYPVAKSDHPLLTHNPHALVPFLEIDLYGDNDILDNYVASKSSRRLFATHMPYICLPESIKKCSTDKIVYLCRNPKDGFVSLWQFTNKLIKLQETGGNPIGEVFGKFCDGVSPYGPFWDHALEYWKQSKENPDRVFFLKFEDMKEQPAIQLRRLAEFLDCPFSVNEEESGLAEEIAKLCSFDHLKSLEVNRNGKLQTGEGNHVYFRRGEVGDWKNHLHAEMSEKLDQIIEGKFSGSGLVL